MMTLEDDLLALIVEREHRMNEDGGFLAHMACDFAIEDVEKGVRHWRVDVLAPTGFEYTPHLAQSRRLVFHELIRRIHGQVSGLTRSIVTEVRDGVADVRP